MAEYTPDLAKRRTNRLIAVSCLAFFGAMLGAAYAAVPLYALFCQITGYGGTTRRAEQATGTVLDRTITIRFDGNVSGDLPWTFQPLQRSVTMKIGETAQAAFRVQNLSGEATSGRAAYNVTPQRAGAYFNKIACFCFNDTTLKPGESLDMPVLFFIDPAVVELPELKDIRTITLSYTFFAAEPEKVSGVEDAPKKPVIGG